ncbi:MAG TPA: OmpA family protein [Alphaproteobacteria bacterium]|nr:OmpA family protein [Alphaproteobacteria bacterium]
MSLARMGAIAVAIGAAAWPVAAGAEPSRLGIIIGGEAYDGPPRFEVTFNGETLGEATIRAAIDTAKAGRFADAPDKTPYVQSFEFEIPEYVFTPDGEVRVRLTNEAYGGDGSNRDRNLFLAAVTVNGGAVTVSGLVTATEEGFKPNATVGEFLLLADGNEEGVSPAPKGGWPDPSTMLAEARLTPDPSAEAGLAPVPGVTTLTAPATGVTLETEAIREASAGPADAPPAGAMAASLGPDEENGCALDQIYNVIGFNANSNALTPRLMARLDQIIEDIGEERCRVQITGYSSTQGSYATNALFAVERAQNVLAYLKANGLKFRKVSATGAGATEQFGPSYAANRRVVITVTP